jgi:hypothetical protein
MNKYSCKGDRLASRNSRSLLQIESIVSVGVVHTSLENGENLQKEMEHFNMISKAWNSSSSSLVSRWWLPDMLMLDSIIWNWNQSWVATAPRARPPRRSQSRTFQFSPGWRRCRLRNLFSLSLPLLQPRCHRTTLVVKYQVRLFLNRRRHRFLRSSFSKAWQSLWSL